MSDKTTCFICKQQDIKSVMQRVKGHGYCHQSCIDLIIAFGDINLRLITFKEMQDYCITNMGLSVVKADIQDNNKQ